MIEDRWQLDFPRKVGLVGITRKGKTVFALANARDRYGKGIWCIDAEHSLQRYKALTDQPLHYPSRLGCSDPLVMDLETERAAMDPKMDIGLVIVDAVTKIFKKKSIRATLAGNLTAERRMELGFSKNQFSNMAEKAEAIQVLANLVAYGTDVIYIWHEGEYMDLDKREMAMRDAISPVERERLLTSVDMILYFDTYKGQYRIRVSGESRGTGRQPPRTEFFYTDPKGNFWKGALDRIEQLVYLSFENTEDAIDWATFTLGYDEKADGAKEKLQSDLVDMYEQVKQQADPKRAADMWYAWIKAIHDEQDRRKNNKKEKPVEVTSGSPPASNSTTPQTEKKENSEIPKIPNSEEREIVEQTEQYDPPAEPMSKTPAEQLKERLNEAGVPVETMTLSHHAEQENVANTPVEQLRADTGKQIEEGYEQSAHYSGGPVEEQDPPELDPAEAAQRAKDDEILAALDGTPDDEDYAAVHEETKVIEAPDGEPVKVEFRNGDPVPAERVEDFRIFVAKIGNEPYELVMLDRAKDHEQNQPWEMP
jgi:hypothetical protein